MKAIEKQQQPNSMDSSDYAYHPLITTTTTATTATTAAAAATATTKASTSTRKHKRAGSTGTTGDEEYTTDEDELYADEADRSGASMHPAHPIMKSDLARAATDLFGYACETAGGHGRRRRPSRRRRENDGPTSLFDEEDEDDEDDDDDDDADDDDDDDDDVQFSAKSSTDASTTTTTTTTARFVYNEKLSSDVAGLVVLTAGTRSNGLQKPPQRRNERERKTAEFSNDDVGPLDLRLMCGTTTAAAREASSDETTTTTTMRGKNVAEIDEQAIAKLLVLQDELKKAQDLLKLKDEEVARLSRFRRDVEQELEELTASLFQEAHNMVREANTRQATAERLLEESRMKAEVLAAEVAALKTLVLTSTPARPNPHLHPQIDARRCSGNTEDGQQGSLALFVKKHRRSPSHLNTKFPREEHTPPESPIKEPENRLPSHRRSLGSEDALAVLGSDVDANDSTVASVVVVDRGGEKNGTALDGGQLPSHSDYPDKESKDFALRVDPRVHAQFLRWKTSPCVDRSDPFVARVFREDIDLCLDFPNPELGDKVRQAVLDGIIFIEAVSEKNRLAFPKKCALLEAPRQCHYRMRLSDEENQWHCISQLCRNRIIAVCDFLNYLRYVERGLVKSSVHDVYWEITRLRKEMVLARLGLALSS